MIAYQISIKPKHSIHLHTATVSSLPRNAMPTEEIHLVAASGIISFEKQSPCVLHGLVIKTDLKVLLYSSNFKGNSREIAVINSWRFLQVSDGLSSLPIVFQCNQNLGFAQLFVKWCTLWLCEKFPFAYWLIHSLWSDFFVLIEISSYFYQIAFWN